MKFPGIPALYLAITVPIGFLVEVDDMPGRTHYLLYIDEEIEAYVDIFNVKTLFYLNSFNRCFINYGWFYVLFAFPAALAILVSGHVSLTMNTTVTLRLRASS